MTINDEARRAEGLATDQHDGRRTCGDQLKLFETEADAFFFDSTSLGDYTEEELARALRTYKRARAWRERNPIAYQTIERLALVKATRGRMFGANLLKEITRDRDVVQDQGPDYFRLSNDYAPVFARWLRAEHPEIAHLVRIRPCALDIVMDEDANDDGPDN